MENVLDEVLENRKGHYVHAIEVESTYELENVINEVANEFSSLWHPSLKRLFQ